MAPKQGGTRPCTKQQHNKRLEGAGHGRRGFECSGQGCRGSTLMSADTSSRSTVLCLGASVFFRAFASVLATEQPGVLCMFCFSYAAGGVFSEARICHWASRRVTEGGEACGGFGTEFYTVGERCGGLDRVAAAEGCKGFGMLAQGRTGLVRLRQYWRVGQCWRGLERTLVSVQCSDCCMSPATRIAAKQGETARPPSLPPGWSVNNEMHCLLTKDRPSRTAPQSPQPPAVDDQIWFSNTERG